MKTVSTQEMKEIDRRAIEEFFIPGLVLMENAGHALSLEVGSLINDLPGARIAVFCGAGNNGGDGLVAARFLNSNGYRPEIFLARPPACFSKDAAANFAIIQKTGIPVNLLQTATDLSRFDAIIDALLGTGTRGAPSGPYLDAIRCMNSSGKPIVAADIPSGLNGDDGSSPGETVRATRTVTMGLAKKGLLTSAAKEFVGTLVVADIGLPRQLIL